MQILTIHNLLHGKKIDMPPQGKDNPTFKQAPKAKEGKGKQLELGEES